MSDKCRLIALHSGFAHLRGNFIPYSQLDAVAFLSLFIFLREINEPANSARASAGVSYHEFLINEASYKFWAVFQLVTVVVLLYSTFAAIYYARYNYLMNLESGQYDDLLFARSLSNVQSPGLDVQTFQRIVEAVFKTNHRTDRG